MKLTKKIIVVVSIFLFIYFSWVLIFALKPNINDYLEREKFDSQLWIEWTYSENGFKLRWNMTNDLTKNYILVGKEVKEIKKILGQPSTESKTEISYFLGLTGHGINTGNLIFKIENDRIKSFKIWQG